MRNYFENENKKTNMKQMFTNMYGAVEGFKFDLATQSIALPVNGEYFIFDKNHENLLKVTHTVMGQEFDGFKMPVAPNTLQKGDVIEVDNKYLFVLSATTNGEVKCLRPSNGVKSTIRPAQDSIMGLTVTKVISMMEMMNQGGTQGGNPMQNMLPFMMMNGDEEDEDFNPITFMMMSGLFNQGGTQGANPMQNMLPFMMMGNGEMSNKNMMLMMMLGNNNMSFKTPFNNQQTLEQPAFTKDQLEKLDVATLRGVALAKNIDSTGNKKEIINKLLEV